MKRFTILLLLLASLASCGKEDWRDTSLPASDRAKLLLREMTLEEKVGQMCQYVAPCYVPPGQGSPYKNIDATDENLGNKDLADKIDTTRMKKPAFRMIVVATGEYAYRRKDGIIVAPLSSLKP